MEEAIQEKSQNLCTESFKELFPPAMFNKELLRISKVARTLFAAKDIFKEGKDDGQVSRGEDRARYLINYSDGNDLEVRLTTGLGGFHLHLLETLIAMAQKRDLWISPDTPRESTQTLRKKLALEHQVVDDPVLVVSLSYYSLAIQMGREPSSQFRRNVQEALIDLSGAHFIWRRKKRPYESKGKPLEAYNLISHIVFEGKNIDENTLIVSLSPLLSAVIKRGGKRILEEIVDGDGDKFVTKETAIPFTQIKLEEVRKLKRHATIVLHGWLSSLIQPGQSKTILIQTLIKGVIWRNRTTELDKALLRNRKHVLLCELLPDLRNSGWICEEERDRIIFTRPEKEPKTS